MGIRFKTNIRICCLFIIVHVILFLLVFISFVIVLPPFSYLYLDSLLILIMFIVFFCVFFSHFFGFGSSSVHHLLPAICSPSPLFLGPCLLMLTLILFFMSPLFHEDYVPSVAFFLLSFPCLFIVFGHTGFSSVCHLYFTQSSSSL